MHVGDLNYMNVMKVILHYYIIFGGNSQLAIL